MNTLTNPKLLASHHTHQDLQWDLMDHKDSKDHQDSTDHQDFMDHQDHSADLMDHIKISLDLNKVLIILINHFNNHHIISNPQECLNQDLCLMDPKITMKHLIFRDQILIKWWNITWKKE